MTARNGGRVNKPARKSRAVAKAPVARRTRRSAEPVAPEVIVLPAHFDIRSVAGLARLLRERVSIPAPVLIDAGAVASTDTAGLQLLLAARRAAETKRVAFEWRAVSDAVRATSATIGIGAALGLPEVS